MWASRLRPYPWPDPRAARATIRARGLDGRDRRLDVRPATNTITFHGAAGASIQGGAIADVDIVYGCNMPPVG